MALDVADIRWGMMCGVALLGCAHSTPASTVDDLVDAAPAPVSSIPDAGRPADGGTPEAGAAPCQAGIPNACPQGEYCSVDSSCHAGTCKPIPLAASAYAPVCGCDEVTYWNETVAAQYLTGVKAAGLCDRPRFCNADQPCPLGQSCALAASQRTACTRVMQGSCVGLPDTCPATPQGVACDPNAPLCSSLCEVMKATGTAIAHYAFDNLHCQGP
jgi:hypothetical protein